MKLLEMSSKNLTGHHGDVNQVIFLSDGRLASCSDDTTIKVWDVVRGQELFTLKGHTGMICAMAILINGWLASGSGDSTIRLWDLLQRNEVRTLKGHKGAVVSLRVLKNGNLASLSVDDTIRIWNPYSSNNNLLLTMSGHGNKKWIFSFAVLSNDLLVTCSVDQNSKKESTIRVWDPNRGQLVKRIPTGLKSISTVKALANDQIAIGTAVGSITIFDLENDADTRIKEKAHSEGVSCLLQLSNKNLVSSGRDEDSSSPVESIKVWQFSDLSLLQHLNTYHVNYIQSLSISQDETELASGSQDLTIKLWPISP